MLQGFIPARLVTLVAEAAEIAIARHHGVPAEPRHEVGAPRMAVGGQHNDAEQHEGAGKQTASFETEPAQRNNKPCGSYKEQEHTRHGSSP
jgi:hypothetical protein